MRSAFVWTWIGFFGGCSGGPRHEVPPDPDGGPDAAVDAGDPCDRDQDGFRALDCGADDCVDDDASAHPGGVDTWQTETVDEDFGAFTSIAVDSAGAAHISYAPGDSAREAGWVDLRYATNAGGVWSIEIAGPGEGADFYTSIALDGSGMPHIAYENLGTEVRLLSKMDGDWFSELVQVDPVGDDVFSWGVPQLALEPSGTEHIGYGSAKTPVGGGQFEHGVVHLTRGPEGWVADEVQPDDDVGATLGTAVGADGSVHFVYSDWTHGEARYATKVDGAWVTTTIGTSRLDLASVRVDADGNVHAALLYDLLPTYATNASGSWMLEPVGVRSVMPGLGLALDASGAAHICYASGSDPSDLHYVTNADGEWVDATIDVGETITGRWCSIAVAPDGVVHISYDDRAAMALRHAWGRRPDGTDQDCDGQEG